MTSHVVELGSCRAEIRLGRWEDVLADVTCDALITDPPYGARTHDGHRVGVENADPGRMRVDRRNGSVYACGNVKRRDIDYGHWSADDVAAFIASWAERTRGWICAMTSHDLAPAWQATAEDAGRYSFAPLPCVMPGMTVRLTGDGPSSWCVWLMVARPRTQEAARWGTLPGAYTATRDRGGARIGGKPIDLMRQIVSDYSRPGDLVCDPCAGYATTLAAALLTGRNAIGAEMDPAAYDQACRVLDTVSAQQVLGL